MNSGEVRNSIIFQGKSVAEAAGYSGGNIINSVKDSTKDTVTVICR